MNNLSQLKQREEAKREAAWDPAERWKVIQDTITWAEAQTPRPRNSPQRCLEEEARRRLLIR